MSTTSASPPRLTLKGQATRNRIVAAAAGLFFQRGVRGTSIEEVKAEALVSSSQLYHYFEDKQTLVRAVIQHQIDAVLAAQQPLLGSLDSLASLRAWRDLVVGIQRSRNCEGGCPLGSLAGELAEADLALRLDMVDAFSRWEAEFRRGLEMMHARGELRPDADPSHLALALLAAAQGGALLTQLRRETAPLEAALEAALTYIESFMRG